MSYNEWKSTATATELCFCNRLVAVVIRDTRRELTETNNAYSRAFLSIQRGVAQDRVVLIMSEDHVVKEALKRVVVVVVSFGKYGDNDLLRRRSWLLLLMMESKEDIKLVLLYQARPRRVLVRKTNPLT